MKHSIKPAFLCLIAVLFWGCLPHEKLTGRVIDTAGPVPEATVLGMVWIEDADKARPVPDTEDLKPEDRDAALEKDMKDRGLPVAYARAFSDKNGWFTLDRLHFSAETKKAVKAMKQPKITRITLNVFQRGYLKHAVTIFPKGAAEDLPPVTVSLSRPESWKQLALDNYFRTLRRDEYDYGYSKEFGATKEEKNWFLEYTHSNLNKAYTESNIKGDKQWEEDCGHDYNDIVISTAGIQRNPKHEKCNQLLWQMGALREWEERWLDHSVVKVERAAAAISVVKVAINDLDAKYAEVKANESQIIAGVAETAKEYEKNQINQNLRNGLNESKTGTEEAQQLYNNGDKTGAYKALGHSLHTRMPNEIRQGTLTAQLVVKTVPGITDTVAGFYLLMNKPLTAQLPGGDDGNHKDKPKAELKESTGTIKDMPLKELVDKIKATTDPREKHKLKMQLWGRTPRNVKELNELLDIAEAEKENDIQRDILKALGDIKDISFGPVFRARIKKGSIEVRAAAIRKITQLKYRDAVPDLIKLAKDFDYVKEQHKKESVVPFYAFLALGEIGDERAIPTVMGKLGKMGGQDAEVVAKFGKKVVPQLLKILRTSKDEQESNEAGNAMGLINDKELVPEMWQIFKDKNDKARYTALNVLLNTTDSTTSPTADDVMDYVVASAKTNPAMLSNVVDVARRRKDIPYLIKTFQDPTVPHNLRTAAIGFLGEFKAQSAVPALKEALQNSDKEIRMEAAYVLKQITDKDYSRELK